MSAAARTIDRRMPAILVALLLAVAPAACKQAEAEEPYKYTASKITPSEDGEHPVVTVTQTGAEKIGLQTATVEKNGDRTRIPYAAVLYDAEGGQPYVFVNTEGLSFLRQDITVDNIEGDMVDVSKGLEPDTRVVTQGLAEIHGAELEYGQY